MKDNTGFTLNVEEAKTEVGGGGAEIASWEISPIQLNIILLSHLDSQVNNPSYFIFLYIGVDN